MQSSNTKFDSGVQRMRLRCAIDEKFPRHYPFILY